MTYRCDATATYGELWPEGPLVPASPFKMDALFGPIEVPPF
jgi:hypothetical protein